MEDTPKKPELKLVDEEITVDAGKPQEAPESPEKAPEGTCTCKDGCSCPKGSAEAPKTKPVIEVDLKELQAEVEKLMEDDQAQKFAEAMVLGTQVFLWGVHCIHELDHSKAALGTFLEAIKASMTLDGVNPRPFSAENTLENLTAFMPSFAAEVKVRAEKATTTVEDVVKAVADAQQGTKEEAETTEEKGE